MQNDAATSKRCNEHTCMQEVLRIIRLNLHCPSNFCYGSSTPFLAKYLNCHLLE